jgi:hypothetical protein
MDNDLVSVVSKMVWLGLRLAEYKEKKSISPPRNSQIDNLYLFVPQLYMCPYRSRGYHYKVGNHTYHLGLSSCYRRDKCHEGENTKTKAEKIQGTKKEAKGLEDKEKKKPKKRGVSPVSALLLPHLCSSFGP